MPIRPESFWNPQGETLPKFKAPCGHGQAVWPYALAGVASRSQVIVCPWASVSPSVK